LIKTYLILVQIGVFTWNYRRMSRYTCKNI